MRLRVVVGSVVASGLLVGGLGSAAWGSSSAPATVFVASAAGVVPFAGPTGPAGTPWPGGAATAVAVGTDSVYVIPGDAHSVVRYSISGQSQGPLVTGLNVAAGVAVDGAGNVYVADAGADQVLQITPGGARSVVAGASDGLVAPDAVAVDAAGDLYIADIGSDVNAHVGVFRRAAGGGALTAVTPRSAQLAFPAGIAVDATNNVYVADPVQGLVLRFAPDGSVQSVGSGLDQPSGVALDAAGDVLVATATSLVRIPPAGQGSQSTVGSVSNGFGVAAVRGPAPTKDPTQLTARSMSYTDAFDLGKMTLSATLVDSLSKQPMAGARVTMTTSSQNPNLPPYTCSGVTDSSGVATCVPSNDIWTMLNSLTNRYTAAYAGDPTHLASTSATTLPLIYPYQIPRAS